MLTVFFATSFTTALQRVYLRAWRARPAERSAYTRGPAWLVAMLVYMAISARSAAQLGDGAGLAVFVIVALAVERRRCGGSPRGSCSWARCGGGSSSRPALITAIAMAGYAFSASVWMPDVVTRNEAQFGFFGVALALVTWFSGAAICVIVGACAGPVLAEDSGRVGTSSAAQRPICSSRAPHHRLPRPPAPCGSATCSVPKRTSRTRLLDTAGRERSCRLADDDPS